MSTKSKKKCRRVSMAILLWGIMMVMVLVTVVFMWVFQIHFMERNYTDILVWERIADGENYAAILAGETYCHETVEGNRIVAFRCGTTVRMLT